MAVVEKSVLVFYSARQMFVLVDRVEDYPVFLPWCGGTEVQRISDDVLEATVHIDYHHIRQSFSTENTRQEPNLIEMRFRRGPFSHLEGCWRFIELDETACKIEFRLHYEFSTKLLDKLVSPVFGHIANSFVEAFVQRATVIYGEP
ncbi:MAG TPA: type II toxin-antitoxin system RatA family toxin [Sulfuricella sp.]|nr:type II toxin-antitoxin system RatA family toxin [Sulfuricella sp.]